MNRCKRCGRQLKSESSKKIGYGSHCAKLENINIYKPRKNKININQMKLEKWS